jgi:hypothetical protein
MNTNAITAPVDGAKKFSNPVAPVNGTATNSTIPLAPVSGATNSSTTGARVASVVTPAPKPKPFSIKGQSQTGWIGQEKKRLKKLEGIVERGMSTFIEVGDALTEIRDRKLYRLSPFGGQSATFEEYAFRKFGFSRAHAYRHIKTSKVQTVLSPFGDKTPSENRLPSEAVARELARLLKWPDKLKQAWDNLKKTRTPLLQVEKKDYRIDRLAAVTARDAAAEVAHFLPPKPKKDKTVAGSPANPLAAELRAMWGASIGANIITLAAIDELIDKLTELRRFTEAVD